MTLPLLPTLEALLRSKSRPRASMTTCSRATTRSIRRFTDAHTSWCREETEEVRRRWHNQKCVTRAPRPQLANA